VSISNPLVAGSSPAGRARKEAESSSRADAAGPPLAHPLQSCNAVDSSADGLEATLADAITKATIAGRFDVVAQLCKELEARRLARLGNVVALDSKRKGGAR